MPTDPSTYLKKPVTTTTNNPPPQQGGSFTVTGSTNPSSGSTGQSLTINAAVKNATSQSTSDALVDIEVYNSGGGKVFQQYFEHQNFAANESRTISANWTPTTNGTYSIKVGVFSAGWSTLYTWIDNAGTFNVGSGGTNPNPPPTNNPPPASGSTVNIWWPSDGATVSGTQPFKAELQDNDVSTYKMYWQVDGDTLNEMYNSSQDYPHKEVIIDLSGWNWKGTGPYNINFVAKDNSGNILGQKSSNINISH